MLGIDVSNYTGPLQQETLRRWRDDHGVGLVIVQSLDPPAGYPPGVTIQQLQACAQFGMAVDAYLWLWTHSDARADMARKLRIVDDSGVPIRKVWMDIEDTAASTPDYRIQQAREALRVIDAWCAARGVPGAGVYSAKWYWPTYMGNTREFGSRELWDADYDGVPDNEHGWSPYGGFVSRRIKQYAGTSTLAGQGGIDLNVLSTAEEAEVLTWQNGPPPSPPDPLPEPPPNDVNPLVHALGYLRGDVYDALMAEANRKGGPRKRPTTAIANEIARVGEQFLGPRPTP